MRLLVFFAMALVVAACGKQEQDHSVEEAAAFYKQAAEHAGNHEYRTALELLQKGLALDTLGGFSSRAADALNRKRVIESMTGEYFEALASHGIIEQRCRGMLPEAAEARRIRSKAALFAELGKFVEAEKTLMGAKALSVQDSLELARYMSFAGNNEKAFYLYSTLSKSADPALALEAYTGLLGLSLGTAPGQAEDPSVYTYRIVGLARKLVGEGRKGQERTEARALRSAALWLELFPAHAKDASYLFFKALLRARAAGDERLVQLLDFESNAVLAQKEEVYARTLDYFERNNMQLARMAALLKQGIGTESNDDARIKALKKGLSIYRYQVSPFPGQAMQNLVDRSTGELTELLLSKGRYAEAFESDELRKLSVLRTALQQGYDSFVLPKEHKQLEREVITLSRELNALLQRQMNNFQTGRGYQDHAATIEAVNRKRGKLYEKLGEVRDISPLFAERLVMSPVTLRTVQEKLDEGHAVMKLIEGRNWCTVFLVENSYVDVSRRKVNGTLFQSRLKLFREHLAANDQGGSTMIANDFERLWLTNLLLKPYRGRLRDINRLTVLADEPFPAHLLGNNRFLVRDFPVSWMYSANELVRQNSQKESHTVEEPFTLFEADRYREALEKKLYFPHQAVFLLWKNFSTSEKEELRVLLALSLQQGGDPSVVLHQLAQNSGADSDQWMYFSEYGVTMSEKNGGITVERE